jgi:hypothetical protein
MENEPVSQQSKPEEGTVLVEGTSGSIYESRISSSGFAEINPNPVAFQSNGSAPVEVIV